MKILPVFLLTLPGLAPACQTTSSAPRAVLTEDSGLEEVSIVSKGLE